METVTVTDLYEAAYLLLSGSEIESVRCVRVSQSIACRFIFSGEGSHNCLEQLRLKQASANIALFRNAYSQINGLLHEAKRSYEKEQKTKKNPAINGGSL